MDEIELLTQRIDAAERELAAIRTVLRQRITESPAPPASPLAASDPVSRWVPRRTERGSPPRDPEAEAVLVGTWFARLGAVAVLLGAAFGFKYAVDRGWIGPTGRVVLGLVAGLAFVFAAERARSRDWPRLAQALAGGGVGLAYLSVWAAFALYALIPASVAFVALAAVTAAGVALSLRHDAAALAVLALVGGFLNPYLTGLDRAQTALLAYVVLLDAGVLTTAYFRRWRVVDAVALVATWAVAFGTAHHGEPAPTLAFGAIYFAVFAGRNLMHAVARRRPTEELDLLLGGINASAFFGIGLLVLDERLHGAFSLALGALHFTLAMLVRTRVPSERNLQLSLVGAGVVFVTLAIPFELNGRSVAVAWAVEGAALVGVGHATGIRRSVLGGLAVLGLSVADSLAVEFELGEEYVPARLLFSVETFTLWTQIAALYAVAWLLRRGDEWSGRASQGTVLAANVVTLLWLTFEAQAAFGHPSEFGTPHAFAQLQFTVTALWALYATALLSVGVAGRLRGVRLMAVALFALTVVKLALFDLWLLESLHRTIAFIGLGLLLLLGSLMYHRFRDLVVTGAPQAGPSEG